MTERHMTGVFEEAFARIRQAGGIVEAMRQGERELGYEIVEAGAVDWLPLSDWPPEIVVSRHGRKVRIVAIRARKRGSGAFGRLITGLAQAGLEPIVVEPILDMPAILQRWGWQGQKIGAGFERHSVWTPPAGWLVARAARGATAD